MKRNPKTFRAIIIVTTITLALILVYAILIINTSNNYLVFILSIGLSIVASVVSFKVFSKGKEVGLIKALKEENQKLEFHLLQMTTKIMRAKAPNIDSLH